MLCLLVGDVVPGYPAARRVPVGVIAAVVGRGHTAVMIGVVGAAVVECMTASVASRERGCSDEEDEGQCGEGEVFHGGVLS
jgi:hypothetical protein